MGSSCQHACRGMGEVVGCAVVLSEKGGWVINR